jgi:hypothetical protein
MFSTRLKNRRMVHDIEDATDMWTGRRALSEKLHLSINDKVLNRKGFNK